MMSDEPPCDLPCDIIETVPVHQREDGGLNRCHRRREAEHPSDLAADLVLCVGVLQGDIDHPIDTV